jgi:hypothetical protein
MLMQTGAPINNSGDAKLAEELVLAPWTYVMSKQLRGFQRVLIQLLYHDRAMDCRVQRPTLNLQPEVGR